MPDTLYALMPVLSVVISVCKHEVLTDCLLTKLCSGEVERDLLPGLASRPACMLQHAGNTCWRMPNSAQLWARYDELHMNAVVNWTKATKSDGTPLPGIPALMGTSLQVHAPPLHDVWRLTSLVCQHGMLCAAPRTLVCLVQTSRPVKAAC